MEIFNVKFSEYFGKKFPCFFLDHKGKTIDIISTSLKRGNWLCSYSMCDSITLAVPVPEIGLSVEDQKNKCKLG